jgi:uncharacterized protein YoaH (UPF0181 family)
MEKVNCSEQLFVEIVGNIIRGKKIGLVAWNLREKHINCENCWLKFEDKLKILIKR